jgi:hypothetical protein
VLGQRLAVHRDDEAVERALASVLFHSSHPSLKAPRNGAACGDNARGGRQGASLRW